MQTPRIEAVILVSHFAEDLLPHPSTSTFMQLHGHVFNNLDVFGQS